MKHLKDLNQSSLLFIIVLAAAVLRLGWVLYSPALPAQDFADYLRLAFNLVDGLGYQGTAGATAFRPPGYPLFLAGVFWLFGKSLLAAKLANVALGVGTVYLAYVLTRQVFNVQMGLVTAVLVACMPSLILYTSLLATENLATFLLLLSMVLFIAGAQREKLWLFLLSGLSFGLTALTRANFLPLVGLLGLALLLMRQNRYQKVVLFGLTLACGVALVLGPWIARNQRQFGHFIPATTNGGFNLLISFNEDSSGEYLPSITERVFGARFDWAAYRLVGIDWDKYTMDKAATDQARQYMREHPERVLMLAPAKLYYLLRDDVSGVYENGLAASRPLPSLLQLGLKATAQLCYMAIIALALGAASLHRSLQKHPYYVLMLMPLLFMLLLHLVFFGMDRFHLPYLPYAAGFSAFTAVYLSEFVSAKKQSPSQAIDPGLPK